MSTTSFTYSSDIVGLGNLALSLAHGTAADNIRTINAIPIGGWVVATSRAPGVGTYVIGGVGIGATTDIQPYANTYQLVHRITWITPIILVPDTDIPVSTTTQIKSDLADRLFRYVAAHTGLVV